MNFIVVLLAMFVLRPMRASHHATAMTVDSAHAVTER
jgi:hypothetical protein